jgi:hypothetical protein
LVTENLLESRPLVPNDETVLGLGDGAR